MKLFFDMLSQTLLTCFWSSVYMVYLQWSKQFQKPYLIHNLSRNEQKMMQTAWLGKELTSICKWLPLYISQYMWKQNSRKLQQLYLQQKFISLVAWWTLILLMIIMKKLDLFIQKNIMNQISQWRSRVRSSLLNYIIVL